MYASSVLRPSSRSQAAKARLTRSWVAPSGIGKLCTVVQAGTIVAVLAAPWLLQLAGTKLGLGILSGMGFFTVFITLFSGVDYLYAAHLCLVDSDEITLRVEDRPGRE